MHTLLFAISSALTFPQLPNIYLEVVGNNDSSSDWAFFAPHETEFVANKYVAKQINNKGGVFVVLRQQGKRLVTFDIDNNKVSIDPNRMFTKRGRLASLNKLNSRHRKNLSLINKAEKRAEQLSLFVLAALSGKKPPTTIVAMHNNSNGFDGDGHNGIGNVSIVRYQSKLASGAQYLIDTSSGKDDEDDLYFVTNKNDFSDMKAKGWNAVLQNPNVSIDPEEDDGSLSVYSEMKGYRYINIEAERVTDGFGTDHLSKQIEMVNYTFSLLEKN